MAGRDDRLDRLVQVGGVLKDAALARLRQAAQACRTIETAIAGLDDEARRAADETDIALLALFDDSRARRHQQIRTALNAELARARAEEARLMKEAALAFGRDDAIRALVARSQDR